MKMVSIFLLLLGVGFGALYLVYKDQCWLMLNGSDAEAYASNLLSNMGSPTPEKFIDYSISSIDGFVLFSKHNNHSTIYGYFPTRTPNETGGEAIKLEWKPLDDNWYVSHP